MQRSTTSSGFPDINVWVALAWSGHVHHVIARRWFKTVDKGERVGFFDEPADLEPEFRALTRLRHPDPKDWADSYLAAFASVADLTVVTFDRALQGKAGRAVLLKV